MIALYPGAFKPPHKGHFKVVERLLKGNHGGNVYDVDSRDDAGLKSLSGNPGEVQKIDKVIIFLGGAVRNGITIEESKQIWEIYSKYLGNVEIVAGNRNPLVEAKEYAKANPEEDFYAITGLRDESDLIDLKRITAFKNTTNVLGLAIPASPDSNTRATDLRKAVLDGNLDNIRDFFPEHLSREELLVILKMLKDNIIKESMMESIDSTFNNLINRLENPEELLKEYRGTTPIKMTGATRSEDKAKLVRLYRRLQDMVGDRYYDIIYNQDHIRIQLPGMIPENQTSNSIDSKKLTEYIGSILEYMIDQGMKISPLPEVKIKRDEANAANFFGKTAYYNPGTNEIVLYVEGRHMKDICRSFTHEMIHHIQNLEGRLTNIQTSNTNEDDYLLEIEKEAYLKGNITFRNWEDSQKNSSQDLNEGRYDTLTNQLSRLTFKFFKDLYDQKKKDGKFLVRIGNPDHDQVDIESKDFEFDFEGSVEFTEDTYKVDGGANAGFDNEGDEIQPIINISFNIPNNPDWQEISMDLKDVVRHELEHLTQDGENLKQGKYIPDDQDLRALIDSGILDQDTYYSLPKEIDAMIQGLYMKAKKSKTPFSDVVDDYLQKVIEDPEVQNKVKEVWNKRLPALGIKYKL